MHRLPGLHQSSYRTRGDLSHGGSETRMTTKNPALAQLKRLPVIIVLALMLLLAGLLLLERTGPTVGGSNAKSSKLEFVNIGSDKADDGHHGENGKGDDDDQGQNGHHEKH